MDVDALDHRAETDRMESRCEDANVTSATAIHEAAHAVIGRKLGMLCGHATIEADEDSAGHAITADPHAIYYHWDRCGHFRDFSSVFRGRIITFMAGREAEVEIVGECRGGDGDDTYQIGLMLAEMSDDDEQQDRTEARLRSATRMLVRRHRLAIERVARELERRRTLSPDELDELAPGPQRSPVAWFGEALAEEV